MEVLNWTLGTLLPSEAVWSPWAHYYASLPLFPLFQTVLFILTAITLRSEHGSLQFTFSHPIASCVMTYVVASSGAILANLMLAKPLLDCVVNGWSIVLSIVCCLILRPFLTSFLLFYYKRARRGQLVLASFLLPFVLLLPHFTTLRRNWYLIYFSPFDVFYYLCAATPVRLMLLTIHEFARAKKVLSGVTMAAALYPNSLVAMAIVGMFKGSGARWGITWYRLLYQPQSARNHELLSISFFTKATFSMGLLFAYNHSRKPPLVDDANLLVAGALVLTFWTLFLRATDPFTLPQSFTWRVATSLSFPPPNRPGINTVTEDDGKEEDREHLKKD